MSPSPLPPEVAQEVGDLLRATAEACGHTLVGMVPEGADWVLQLRRNEDGHEFEAVLSRPPLSPFHLN